MPILLALPILKVGSNAAKNIYSKGSQITTGSNKALIAGVCGFIYYGTQFHLIGGVWRMEVFLYRIIRAIRVYKYKRNIHFDIV